MAGALGGKLLGDSVKNKYRADETSYNQAIDESQANSLDLQKMLMDQATGGGPNLAQQQFQNATQQLQQQAAGQIASLKGISPAAQARLLQQQQAGIAQNMAGEAAAQRMQQQLAAQQMLGQQALGMFDVASGRKLGAQEVNAGVTTNNTKAQTQLIGGALNSIGGAASMGAGKGAGKWSGGEVEADDGPASEFGRALMGGGSQVFMADGGVPGAPVVPGNSPTNDVVPAMLSPGEIVIPRTHATPEGAASFVEALQRRNGGGYGQVVAARMACGGKV